MVNLPYGFNRLYDGPIDPTERFTSTAELNAYLSNPVRYSGQIVSLVENAKVKIKVLNETKDAWLDVALADSADKDYTHQQVAPSNVWTIEHNLNKKPSVIVMDSANTEILGSINYVDNNNLTITFSAGFSGEAYLN